MQRLARAVEAAEMHRERWASATQEPASRPADNFTSVVTRIRIFPDDGSPRSGGASWILKKPFEDRAKAALMGCEAAFENECLWYGEALEAFQLQLPVPRCIKADPDSILLEDLSLRGYVMHERTSPLDEHHMKLALKALGLLHGASMTLREKDPRKYRGLVKRMREVRGRTAMAADLHRVLQEVANIDTRLRRYQATDLFLCLEREAVRHPDLNAICHGDYWSNNLLFRYDGEGMATDVAVLDFQGIQEAPAGCDIVFLVEISGGGDYGRLLGSYAAGLLEAGREPPPANQLLDHVSRCRLYGLLRTLYYLPAVLMDEAYAAAISSMDPSVEEHSKALKASPEYVRRLRRLVDRYEQS